MITQMNFDCVAEVDGVAFASVELPSVFSIPKF